MNKWLFHILFVIVLLAGSELNGRQTGPFRPGESVALFSDRDLYIAGETILFSAFLIDREEAIDALRSSVIYCELITPWGSMITGNKFLIENSQAEGPLNIPSDLITGIYYLRAYTRSMRNYGPYSYSYIKVKIVNPYRNEVQEAAPDSRMTESPSDTFRVKDSGSLIHIFTDKQGYRQRDTIDMLIEADPSFRSSLKGLTLAVVPEASVSAGMIRVTGSDIVDSGHYHITESRGISVTGKLTDTLTGRSLPYTRVSLSIMGKGKDFMAVQTDTAGRFFFLLPDYTGHRDIFLCAEKAAGPGVSVLIDNDFCTAPVMIPSGNPELSPPERQVAYKMAVNLQLASFFSADTLIHATDDHGEERAFYGTPDDILYIDDYIELPTLEEYLNGLPTLVRVRKSRGQKYFKVLGTQAGINNFDPLVLVDMVAVDDPERILAISPSNISRIEVVNEMYLKGDETFGGIISIISRQGDFAGIDLPESGVFINYAFLSEKGHLIPPAPSEPKIPDTRATLFWDPDLRFGEDGSARIKLTASDLTGRYIIRLFGISREGETILHDADFEVVRR